MDRPIKKGDLIVLRGTTWPVSPVTKIQRQDRTITKGNHLYQREYLSHAHLHVREPINGVQDFRLDAVELAPDDSVTRYVDQIRQQVADTDAMIDRGDTFVGFTPSMMLASRNLVAQRAGLPERVSA